MGPSSIRRPIGFASGNGANSSTGRTEPGSALSSRIATGSWSDSPRVRPLRPMICLPVPGSSTRSICYASTSALAWGADSSDMSRVASWIRASARWCCSARRRTRPAPFTKRWEEKDSSPRTASFTADSSGAICVDSRQRAPSNRRNPPPDHVCTRRRTELGARSVAHSLSTC